MDKYNRYKLSMRMKYGSEWDAPLFRTKSQSLRPEPETPRSGPDIIDDATEDKAEVYNNMNKLTAKEQRERVLSVIKKFGAATDNQVARELNIHPSTVSARRNELRDLGLVVPVLDNQGGKVKIKDKITNTSNILWKVKLK